MSSVGAEDEHQVTAPGPWVNLNLPTSQVIDTYVYQIGLQQFEFALATAIGLMKSVFALVLLVGANLASKKLTDSGLF